MTHRLSTRAGRLLHLRDQHRPKWSTANDLRGAGHVQLAGQGLGILIKSTVAALLSLKPASPLTR